MRSFLAVVSILSMSLASSAFAKDPAKSFSDQKQEKLKFLTEHDAAIQAAKACVEGASDEAALKKCEEQLENAKKKCRKKCHCDHGKGKGKSESDHD